MRCGCLEPECDLYNGSGRPGPAGRSGGRPQDEICVINCVRTGKVCVTTCASNVCLKPLRFPTKMWLFVIERLSVTGRTDRAPRVGNLADRRNLADNSVPLRPPQPSILQGVLRSSPHVARRRRRKQGWRKSLLSHLASDKWRDRSDADCLKDGLGW